MKDPQLHDFQTLDLVEKLTPNLQIVSEYDEETYNDLYSCGFYERILTLPKRRKGMDDPEDEEFLNQRAGAESLMNEVYYQDGKKTKFAGGNQGEERVDSESYGDESETGIAAPELQGRWEEITG